MIRPADPDRDAAACSAIYAPHVRDSAVSFEDVAPSEKAMAERIRRIQATHPWLVAERDGAVTGFAYGAPHHERAAYRWAANVSVYVDASQLRRGIGRQLYQALFERLRAQRLRIACAGVTLPNEASVRLHEGLGFEPVGVYRRIGFKAGAWRDVGWWQLFLEAEGEEPAEPLPPPAY